MKTESRALPLPIQIFSFPSVTGENLCDTGVQSGFGDLLLH